MSLQLLDSMTRYGNEAAKDIAEAIRRKVFMEVDRFKVIVNLSHSWRANTFTLEYMCDLLEVVHVTLKMSDDMAANAETVTRRRTRVVRKQLEDGTVQEEEVVEVRLHSGMCFGWLLTFCFFCAVSCNKKRSMNDDCKPCSWIHVWWNCLWMFWASIQSCLQNPAIISRPS